MADNGDGDRRRVAAAVSPHADVVLRLTPATFPLETAWAAPFDVLRWRRAPGLPHRAWHGWCRWAQRCDHVRLLAASAARRSRTVGDRRP